MKGKTKRIKRIKKTLFALMFTGILIVSMTGCYVSYYPEGTDNKSNTSNNAPPVYITPQKPANTTPTIQNTTTSTNANNTSTEPKIKKINLENMNSIGDKPKETLSMLTDNYGNTYNRAIYNFSFNNDELEYLLNEQYTRFTGTLYIPEGENADFGVRFSIEADEQTIYRSPLMEKSSKPVDIDINLEGYNHIKLSFSEFEFSNPYVVLCLGNATFYKNN